MLYKRHVPAGNLSDRGTGHSLKGNHCHNCLCISSEKGSSLKGKNLLPFRVDPF